MRASQWALRMRCAPCTPCIRMIALAQTTMMAWRVQVRLALDGGFMVGLDEALIAMHLIVQIHPTNDDNDDDDDVDGLADDEADDDGF